jgi:hypothetical protein
MEFRVQSMAVKFHCRCGAHIVLQQIGPSVNGYCPSCGHEMPTLKEIVQAWEKFSALAEGCSTLVEKSPPLLRVTA